MPISTGTAQKPSGISSLRVGVSMALSGRLALYKHHVHGGAVLLGHSTHALERQDQAVVILTGS